MSRSRSQVGASVSLVSTGVNLVLTVLKGAAGIVGHRRALLADLVALLLLATGALARWAALRALLRVPARAARGGRLRVAALSVVVKEALFRDPRRAAARITSPALHANAWQHRSDALSSVTALAGVAGARLGLSLLDPAAGAAVALLILRTGLGLYGQSLAELVDPARRARAPLPPGLTPAAGQSTCPPSHIDMDQGVGQPGGGGSVLLGGRAGEVLGGYFRRRAGIYLFVLVLFATGVLSGIGAVRGLEPPERDTLAEFLEGFFHTVEPGLAEAREPLLRQAAVEQLVRGVGLVWLLGLSVLGAPLVLAVVFLRGFVLGFTVGFLVDELFVRGLLLGVVAVLPHNLLAVPALLVAASASLTFSLATAQVVFGRRAGGLLPPFVTSGLLTLAGAVAAGLGAVVEVYVTPVLLELAVRYLL